MSRLTTPSEQAETRIGDLRLQLDLIERQLEHFGELGLLSVTVVARVGAVGGRWDEYEAIRHEVLLFLARRMRSADSVLEPVTSGNTVVILLSPPRQDRGLSTADLASVQTRLRLALARHLAARLHPAVTDPFSVYVGCSLMRHEPTVDRERLMYRALEEALADAMRQERVETTDHGHHVRRAIEGDSIVSVYQPLVDFRKRTIIGFEALTRVRGPYSTPDRLFRAAHQSGLLWELERGCRLRALAGLPVGEAGRLLFLNLEPESLGDPEISDGVFREQVRFAGLEPGDIVLEITERSSVTNFGALRESLNRCREIGFRVAVDDVGAGYSSLQTIAEVEPDFLKIDMSLIRDLHLRPVKRELISTIRRFSENTGALLVAEGVESQDELSSLADLGIYRAQGYLFARPAATPRLPDWSTLGWFR